MARSTRSWLVFAAAVLAVCGVMSWLTWALLDAEAREREALSDARRQQTLRVALWRIDSALGSLWALEDARGLAADWPAEAVFGPPSPFVRLYVQRDGEAAFGRVGGGDEAELAALRETVDLDLLAEALGDDESPPSQPGQEALFGTNSGRWPSDENYLSNDYQSRQLNVQRSQQVAYANPGFLMERSARAHPFRPVWLTRRDGGGSELLLARRLRPAADDRVQGVWVDWPALSEWMSEEIGDLFPAAELRPRRDADDGPAAAALASLPVALVPGPDPAGSGGGAGSTSVTLVIAWTSALAALLTVAWGLRASTALSERRGRFVQMVTHELRTPLTTFRMYAEMLADGMVTGEETRQEYLETLKDESDRLSRVVESVLLYSHLEEGRGAARRQVCEVCELLDGMLPRLARRVAQAGMELVAEQEGLDTACVDVDPQAVEQILANLVDNACKYAADADDPRVHLEARSADGQLEVVCRDHGEGIAAGEREDVFRPFRRGARHQAGAAPGVGLGLSLARGLARACGGDLSLDPSRPGAAFRLTLPLAARGRGRPRAG